MCVIFSWTPVDEVRRSRPSDRALLAELWRVFPPQPSEPALPAVRPPARFVLSIAKQQQGTFSRGRLMLYNLALVAVRRVKDAD